MERILVVEDEAPIRKALQMGLTSKDYSVDLASDGASGILLGREKNYDILITDLCLPDINGIEVIEKIKHSLPEIIPIVITGRGDMQSSLEAIRVEVSDYLEKPLSLSSIKTSIARGIKRRSAKREAIENQLNRQALYDALTALPNRILFLELLERSIARTQRSVESQFAVLLVDIDRFKTVNDTCGHCFGDKALIEIAKRLKGCIRAIDTVARMSGNEFAILVEKYRSTDEVLEIAQRCQDAIAKPFSVNGVLFNLTSSVGIVTKTDLYENPGSILRDAEIALDRCKNQGRGSVKTFNKQMLKQAVESLQIENDLQIGIQKREFVLHYQPIIHLESQRIAGFESLIRWNHHRKGMIYPNKFITLAEDSGLINPIGEWVIREGCRQLSKWKRTLPACSDLTLNINISAKQLQDKGFSNFIAKIAHENKLAPRCLKLELTESVLMEDYKAAHRILNEIKSVGIRLAIDDFGTGYSSLSYLQQFPLDDLKIDRSFIRNLNTDSECLEIVKAIIGLAKKLGLKVVAEGVETEAQLSRLKDLGCDMVQGYWFSKPVDKDSAFKLIQISDHQQSWRYEEGPSKGPGSAGGR